MPYSGSDAGSVSAWHKGIVLLAYFLFPRGRFGAGLLILRATLGSVVLARAVLALSKGTDTSVFANAASLIGIAAGGLLIPGLFTPITSIAVVVLCAWAWQSSAPVTSGQGFDCWVAAILSVSTGISLAILGPGAFSADALLFGPRQIVIPSGSGPRPPSNLGS